MCGGVVAAVDKLWLRCGGRRRIGGSVAAVDTGRQRCSGRRQCVAALWRPWNNWRECIMGGSVVAAAGNVWERCGGLKASDGGAVAVEW